jgi:hypothetical protein
MSLSAITVYDNGFLPNNAFSRIHGLNFVGAGVTVEVPAIHFIEDVGIATIRVNFSNIPNDVNISGVVTATAFVGDGSGLTGVVGTGSGVEIQENGSPVGTAATINFRDNLSVDFSGGVATINNELSGISTDSEKLNGEDPSYYLDYNNLTNTPVNLSDFNNDVGFTTFSGDYNDLTNTPVNLSDFNNDVGFITTFTDTNYWVETSVGIHTLSNVGIGTTNPTEELTVFGDARVTGILTVGSSSITLNGITDIINVGSGVTIDGSTGIIEASSIVIGGITFTGISSSNTTVTISDTEPESPVEGNLWYDSTISRGFIYYVDEDSSQWVDFSPSGGGSGGRDGESYWAETLAGIHTLSNVGIGTTNPTEELTVFGDARVTGILTVGTSSITLDGTTNTINVGSGVTIDGSTGIIEASSIVIAGIAFTGSGGGEIGISTDSERLLGKNSSFYLNYDNFINIPQEDWSKANLGIVESGTTVSVVTTYNDLTVRGSLYYPTSTNIGPDVDIIVLYHPSIDSPGVTPSSSALNFLNIVTNTSQINIRDKIIFSVAYPQDAIPDWLQNNSLIDDEFPELLGNYGGSYANFVLGDNIEYAEAALLWVKNDLNSYLSGIGVSKTINRLFTFGHSQGGLLVHRLNTMHQVDGVISNAPGPIDLLTRCSTSESQGDNNISCLKIKTSLGSTSVSPESYNDVSLSNFLSGTLSPVLFTQALDDTTGNSAGTPQVANMQTIVQPGLESCVNCAPVEFRYYDTGGHPAFVTNSQLQEDIREFFDSGTSALHTFKNVGIGTTNPTSALTVKGNTSLETLNVSGISTLGTLQISSGIVTATSGIVTYYGDTSNTTDGRWTLGASGSSDYTFTGIGFISTTNDPILYLARGRVYEFVNNSGGSHPFEIRVSNGGAAYNDGVTNNGAATGVIRFEVPFNAPNTLYYQCTVHSGMGNTINIYPSI